MSLLLNLLWLIFGGGLLIVAQYLFVGILLCLTIIGIPFGVQCFKIAGLALSPFGKEIKQPPRASVFETLTGSLLNILWFLLAGLWIFLSHVTLAVVLMLTIIGIPFALQHVKLGVLALLPFGREVSTLQPHSSSRPIPR
ncbi:MAG TPA: YccF domain-containing protein [Nannocystis exedens]|nr:YccF domain-containing protein [Nannocystis exedens]